MKHLLPLLLLVTSSAWAQDLSAQKQNAQTTAEKSQVELRLDQPYAGNENPKQKVDLYLPKKRNTDKPLPVVALIHGGGWVNGDRLGYAAAAIQFARTGDYASVTETASFTVAKGEDGRPRNDLARLPAGGIHVAQCGAGGAAALDGGVGVGDDTHLGQGKGAAARADEVHGRARQGEERRRWRRGGG